MVQFYPLGKIFKPCIFLLFALSLKQRKIIFKPGITLNQNINLYNETLVKEKVIRMNLTVSDLVLKVMTSQDILNAENNAQNPLTAKA